MKEIFDFKRFGKTLCYDLDNLRNRYGLSLLIISCLPVVMFVFFWLFYIVLGGDYKSMVLSSRISAFVCAAFTLVLSMPVKTYGFLTEKKSGSQWLTLPASTFEKFLSMLVTVLVIVPLFFGAVYLLSDFIMSVCIPEYGKCIAGMRMPDIEDDISVYLHLTQGGVFGTLYYSWVINALVFTLGAIFFKKAKVSKTILCILVFSIIVTQICVIVVKHSAGIINMAENWSAEQAVNRFNLTVNLISLTLIVLLSGGIFWRLKTLKH